MSGLKSFDEFSTKSPKKTNEGIFNRNKRRRNKAKGKDVYKSTTRGEKRHVVKWKGQNDANFVIKIINDEDILDNTSGKITTAGEDKLIKYFNGEQQFIYSYAALDNTFFTNNVIVYTVKRDNDRKQKLQFTIVPRKDLEVELDPSVRFISAAELANQPLIQQQQQNIITPLIPDPIPEDCPEGQVWDEETQTCIEGGEPIIDNDCAKIGDKFNHQSGADSGKYTITIVAMDEFFAQRNDGKAEGTIKISGGETVDEPLIVMWTSKDGSTFEVTNVKDKEFFTKVFQDKEFLCQLVEEFSPEEIASFKDSLYYRSTQEPIYGAVAVASGENSDETKEEIKLKTVVITD